MALVIEKGPTLRERTTLRLGGRTLAEVGARTDADWDELPKALERLGGRPLVLGWGSNILACDGELPLVVVNPPAPVGPAPVGTREGAIVVRVGASVRLPLLLAWTASKGLAGLEGLAGIPGTVGGAVAMNAGSYGCEVGQCLSRVKLFSPSTGVGWIESDLFTCAYRSFAVLGPAARDSFRVILEVEFTLMVGSPELLRKVMKECLARKTATQPVRAASAGCVFRNPAPGVSAGRLMDQAGLKGRSLGGMAFSELHANFLVNTGQGRSEHALELMDIARRVVREKFGHELETEVEVVGCS
ncbi:MAG: UDP-N-acetylmuramate dehydrogenase [Desulfovibrionaceae bacterium]|jgi:UDP-N-acetylmuramate dehydrogenase|nr:UDP-N-acetylmuramate dehydrogenase [Desulfovibrionaceae bacterium]